MTSTDNPRSSVEHYEARDWQGLLVTVGTRVLWRGGSNRLYARWGIGTVVDVRKAHDRGGWNADLNRYVLNIRWHLRQNEGELAAVAADTVGEHIPIGNVMVLPVASELCSVCCGWAGEGTRSELDDSWICDVCAGQMSTGLVPAGGVL